MGLIWLSYPLEMNAPRPPAIPAPSLSEFMSIKNDGANVQFLQCYNHTGTHLDTAAHVIEGGTGLASFLPEDLVFADIRMIEICVADDTVIRKEHIRPFEEEIRDAQALLVKFGVAEMREKDGIRFSNHCPGFADSAAREIFRLAPGLRMIGTDVPSIACISHLDETMAVHNTFFENAQTEKFIIVEEMKLDENCDDISRMTVSPWMVEGMNSGPCVIWAEKEA